MSDQGHRMATWYGQWGLRFQAIVDTCSLSVQDTALAWNVLTGCRSGTPAPANCTATR